MKKNLFYLISSLILILLVSLTLYFNPLFSNKPLGLDTLGHLSKISYINEFGVNVRWDLAWYNGAPFLAYYSPLYYQIASFFNNIIFASNLLIFLSILLTSIGIFFLIDYYSNNKIYSTIFALFFLSVLCTSYYYISVGNLPYVFSIFTVPFTLLFLERSLENKKNNFLFYVLFFVLAYLTHIFIALVLFLLTGLRIFMYECFHKKSIKNLIFFLFIYLGIPILISSFWFLPFLTKSESFIGDGVGYIPKINHLFGFGNYIIWGISPGEIGILFGLFLISLIFTKKYFKEKNEKILFLIISSVLFFLLLKGILGRFYPTGVGAIRFILPFSILSCVLTGAIFSEKFNNKKRVIIILSLLLILALFLNYKSINKNFEKYSYSSPFDRYGLINAVYSLEKFPLNNSFSNYRFGTSRYIFSETLNFKFPWQSQTWGYFDQGMLYPPEMNQFKESVWLSDNLTQTINYFDEYGIKYFEIGGQDLVFNEKFKNNNFSLIFEKAFSDYPFKIYKYNNAKPIISVLTKEGFYEDSFKFEVYRENPDKIILNYNFSGDEKILFKESFHNSWDAKELKSNKKINIIKTENNFMELKPEKNSNQILIYQSKTNIQKLGILFTFLGVSLLIYFNFLKKY